MDGLTVAAVDLWRPFERVDRWLVAKIEEWLTASERYTFRPVSKLSEDVQLDGWGV